MPNGEEVLDQDANDQEEGEVVKSDTDAGDGTDEANDTTETTTDTDSETSKEDDDDGKPDVKTNKTERPVYTMPVSKAQREKKEAIERARAEAKAEHEAEVAKLRAEYEQKLAQGTAKPGDYQADLDKFAAEHGLDPKAAAGLLDVFEKKVKQSLPDISKLDEILKQKEIEGHQAKVRNEFDEKVAPLLLKDYPQATPEHLRQVKERVVELAFSEGFNAYRLEDIYKVNRDDFEFKNGYSAEPSGGRTSELVDFSKMTDEQEIALAKNDPETFKKYLKWQASHESKFLN